MYAHQSNSNTNQAQNVMDIFLLFVTKVNWINESFFHPNNF